MEENEVLAQEEGLEAQDQSGDAFLNGWDETEPSAEALADQQGGEAQGQEPTPDSDGGESDQGNPEEPAGGDQPGEEDGQPADTGEQTWEVNHLGQRKTMRTQDITPELLQKGLDYDRVHQQYDRAKPVLGLISTLAEKAGVSAEEYVRMVRTEAKRGEGMGEDEAKRAIDLEDREAAVSAREAEEKAAADQKESDEAQIQQGISEFAKAFPEVYEKAKGDANAIPDSVWAEVRGGLSLTAAYAKYAVAQAQAETEAARTAAKTAEQNQKNGQRATGSMKTVGSGAAGKDPFLEGWNE